MTWVVEKDNRLIPQILSSILDACVNGASLRDYRNNGELFFNHLKITPHFDRRGRGAYYLDEQYDIPYTNPKA